jgi:Arc/MetJ-type ribon-helix-helix transcriptional regulator
MYGYTSGRIEMSRKMTVVFHDEELYTYLKVEAARRHTAASEIIRDAVRQWLENQEDAELLPMIESARNEWEKKGGRPWSEVEQEMEEEVIAREKEPEARRV